MLYEYSIILEYMINVDIINLLDYENKTFSGYLLGN